MHGALSPQRGIQDPPISSLACEKVAGRDFEYFCQATAQDPTPDDPPNYKFSASAGKITAGDDRSNRRLDLRGVQADSVTVSVEVSWKKMRKWTTTATTKIKLR